MLIKERLTSKSSLEELHRTQYNGSPLKQMALLASLFPTILFPSQQHLYSAVWAGPVPVFF